MKINRLIYLFIINDDNKIGDVGSKIITQNIILLDKLDHLGLFLEFNCC